MIKTILITNKKRIKRRAAAREKRRESRTKKRDEREIIGESEEFIGESEENRARWPERKEKRK